MCFLLHNNLPLPVLLSECPPRRQRRGRCSWGVLERCPNPNSQGPCLEGPVSALVGVAKERKGLRKGRGRGKQKRTGGINRRNERREEGKMKRGVEEDVEGRIEGERERERSTRKK